MRPSLLPGLLSAVQRNLDRGASSLRLFEIGRRYLRRPMEHRAPDARRGAGRREDPARLGDRQGAELRRLRRQGRGAGAAGRAGAPVDNLQVMGEAGAQFHPGQSATLRLGPKTVLARFGMLHPRHC
jgi:phenylalanyl-tRNA synthetase beta chain